MTLSTSVIQLNSQWRCLCEAVREMRVTIAEDKPGDVMLADDLTNAVDDMLGAAEESLALLTPALERGELDDKEVRSALVGCHERFIVLSSRFASGLSSYRHIHELVRLSRVRGRPWRAWTTTVQAAFEQTQPELDGVSRALLMCWQDVAERTGSGAISVYATAVQK